MLHCNEMFRLFPRVYLDDSVRRHLDPWRDQLAGLAGGTGELYDPLAGGLKKTLGEDKRALGHLIVRCGIRGLAYHLTTAI